MLEIVSRPLEYKDVHGKRFVGELALPTKTNGKLPGVLVIHAFRGIGTFEKEKTHELAKNGYAVLGVDLYGDGHFEQDIPKAFGECMGPLVADRPGELKSRLLASLDALKSVSEVDTTKLGAMGYCFGGLCALDMARHEFGLRAVVSFHGNLSSCPDTQNKPLSTAIQVHHGDSDPHISDEAVAAFLTEMRTRGTDFCFISHGKAQHAFTEPEADKLERPGVKYNKEADNRSWSGMLAFFKEHLQSK